MNRLTNPQNGMLCAAQDCVHQWKKEDEEEYEEKEKKKKEEERQKE